MVGTRDQVDLCITETEFLHHSAMLAGAQVDQQSLVDFLPESIVGFAESERSECWLLLIASYDHNCPLIVGISVEESAMRSGDTRIGMSFTVRYRSSGIGIGLEYQDVTVRDTEINCKAVLYLVAYDSELAPVSSYNRPVSGQSQGIAFLHQQPIGQRPNWPAEGRYPPALLIREKTGGHPPTPLGQPRKELPRWPDRRSRLFALRYGIVRCNICCTEYDPAIGHLLLPDAMPMLDATHLLPLRVR
ncbi:hypothetical protein [Mesorhizobium yinganensis]|uniref:hypothetical protein n=1 Tax=Mesorhizobium yinganensis TaxID=3157707 RepID=UPI003CCE1C9F